MADDNGSSGSVTITGRKTLSEGETASNVIIESDGALFIEGGTANRIMINGGFASISSGGMASDTIVNSGGDIYVNSGGTANSTTVNSGGSMEIDDGSIAQNTTVYEGGKMIIKGGSAGHVIMSGGHLFMSSAVIQNLTGSFYGSASISSGCTASGTTVNFPGYNLGNMGYLGIKGGGVANKTTVNSNAYIAIYNGGMASDTIVNSGGYMYASSGGMASDTIVNSGGDMYVSSGGMASDTIVNSGAWMWVSSGGTATNIKLEAFGSVSVHDDATVTFAAMEYNDIVVGGKNRVFDVCDNGIANNTIVNSGGGMYVSSGGTATNVKVEAFGRVSVYDGATVTFAAMEYNDIVVSAGERFYIHDNGIANNTIVNSSGSMYVSSGGHVKDTIVNSGGGMYVSSGGHVKDTIVNFGGDMYISSGGVVAGKLEVEVGAVVSAYQGAVIDFTVAEQDNAAEALISGRNLIDGVEFADLTITVKGNQTNGTYTLASGMSEAFGYPVTVQTSAGEQLGSVSIDQALKKGSWTYTLAQNADTLLLTVTGIPQVVVVPEGITVTTPAKIKLFTQTGSAEPSASIMLSTSNEKGISILSAAEQKLEYKASVDGTGNEISGVIDSIPNEATPQYVTAVADGAADVFLARKYDTWTVEHVARHTGIKDAAGSWFGTREAVELDGKNKIADVFSGNSDSNILYLTDDKNGDALFVDDIYTESPGDGARIAQIDEIRAGDGDDVVDFTSQRFDYDGDGVIIRGGLGDDTIWSNNGENFLFGDEGNDRIVGGSDNDVIVGGIGDDSVQGGGGDDIFCFGGNWGIDVIEQLDSGTVTLWFEDGIAESDLTIKRTEQGTKITCGDNSITVKNLAEDEIKIKFSGEGDYESLASIGTFSDYTSKKIFEDSTEDKNLVIAVL